MESKKEMIYSKEPLIKLSAVLPLVEGEGAFGESAVTFISGLLLVGDGSFYAARSFLELAVGSDLLFLMEPLLSTCGKSVAAEQSFFCKSLK